MTARLRARQSFSDEGLEQLASLVRATAPVMPSPARERRVRASLDRPARPSRLAQRLAWLAAMSGGLALAATMTVRKLTPLPDVTQLPLPAAAPSVPRHRATPRVTQPPPPAVPAMSTTATRRRPLPPPAVPPPTTSAPIPFIEADSDGARGLAEAVSALRQRRDPLVAGQLAERYLRDHPDGALAEEATMLAMEAAAARGNCTGASELASDYLEHFPSGRFAPHARAFAAQCKPN
jgi:hypothetical protein